MVKARLARETVGWNSTDRGKKDGKRNVEDLGHGCFDLASVLNLPPEIVQANSERN